MSSKTTIKRRVQSVYTTSMVCWLCDTIGLFVYWTVTVIYACLSYNSDNAYFVGNGFFTDKVAAKVCCTSVCGVVTTWL